MLYAYHSNHFLNLIAITVFVCFLFSLFKRRQGNRVFECLKMMKGIADKIFQQPGMSSFSTNGGTCLVFLGNRDGGYSVKELLHTTSKFSWKGTFCTSFKAELKGGNAVIVRRLKGACISEMDFRERVEELGILLHENLLPLRAYFLHQTVRFLVYDYMRMGSLEKILHGHKTANDNPLTWEVRCKIAHGVARAIVYLHTTGSNICHGNIKSSNVLLTDSLEPRLSEFGIAQIASQPSPDYQPNVSYSAPEMRDAREVSHETDVYSFGVLLLELLTGRDPFRVTDTNPSIDLPSWIRTMFQEKPIKEVFDHELLLRYQDIGDQMVQLLELAVCCTFRFPHKRPAMVSVLNRIRQICRLEASD